MRALSDLTTRGRGFVAAGLASGLSGVVVGERDLLRIAVFLLTLPVLALLAVRRTRHRLVVERRLEPARISAGQSTTVVLEVHNASRLTTGILLAEDGIPYPLGSRPRFVLNRVEAGGTRTIRYPLRCELRGRFAIGPLTLRLTDPFGMVELGRSFTSSDLLVVTPPTVRLPPVPLDGRWSGRGESRANALASAGEDDVVPREYRDGDDLRRVHWRSTARYGELMVRREEQPWRSRATLLLDARRIAHRGEGLGSSFEWAVQAAASVATHLTIAGYAVRVYDDAGALLAHTTFRSGADGVDSVLDTLAGTSLAPRDRLPTALGELDRDGQGVFVAVLGDLGPADALALARTGRHCATAVAVLLDTASWTPTGSDPADDSTVLLRRAGWRVLTIRRGDDLAAAWPAVAGVSRVSVGTVP